MIILYLFYYLKPVKYVGDYETVHLKGAERMLISKVEPRRIKNPGNYGRKIFY